MLDDDPTILKVLSDTLSAPDIEIITCREIEAAYATASMFPPDLAITDLEVSILGGLEGMRLVNFLVSNYPHCKTIIFSGRVDASVVELGKAAGATRVLEKSVSLAPLRKAVSELLAGSRGSGRQAGIQSVGLLDEVLRESGVRSVLQPIVDLRNNGSDAFDVFAVEALTRGPAGTPLQNPELLFRYADRKHKLLEMDLLCITAALQEAAGMRGRCRLFLNVHPRSLEREGVAARLSELVAAAGWDVHDIVLELTEQKAILNPQSFRRALDSLREDGFRIALDDFGQGNSNLHLLRDLQPEFLKLDGSFCMTMHQSQSCLMLIRATAEMAQKLEIPVIVEHIESASDLSPLHEFGLEYGQGYHFSKPLPCKELPAGARLHV